jgi:zinc/manganese transport system substrate-binding protein
MRLTWLLAILAVGLTAGCGTSAPKGSPGEARVRVVAAENFWGSIAAQVGGDRATVTSIIANPGTDPHAYEVTPSDARAIAQAGYVILNGAGYDPWGQALIGANPAPGRVVMVVGDVLGKKDGQNPHFWYSPGFVKQVVERIASDLGKLDPSGTEYFGRQAAQYESVGLEDYFATIATIKQRYVGTKVGATESIFTYLAAGLGLDLVTPYTYLKAISEGTDPSAADRAAVEKEITGREIKVFMFNSQNSTPDVQGLVDRARAEGIPIVKMTETLTPQDASFQDWQALQLKELLRTLGG